MKDNITKTYKKAWEVVIAEVNLEAKGIACSLGLEERMEVIAKKPAFVTLKDHKENFITRTSCRLINPGKSEPGIISKKRREQINQKARTDAGLNQ